MRNIDVVCEMFGDVCSHCSEEHELARQGTRVVKDERTGLFRPDGRLRRQRELGQFCNNDGRHFVRDMKYCPSRFGRTRPGSGMKLRGDWRLG